MEGTCSPNKSSVMYKIGLLLLLITILSISLFIYYKSLKSMKQREETGR